MQESLEFGLGRTILGTDEEYAFEPVRLVKCVIQRSLYIGYETKNITCFIFEPSMNLFPSGASFSRLAAQVSVRDSTRRSHADLRLHAGLSKYPRFQSI